MEDLRQQGIRFDASGWPEKNSLREASQQIAPATPAPSPAPLRQAFNLFMAAEEIGVVGSGCESQYRMNA
jgi:hypothetical protein